MLMVTSLLWKEDGLWACCDGQIIPWDKLMLNTSAKPLMQFTGLHDKNGKEIWEGDVLKNTWRNRPYSVSFFEGGFRGHWDYLEPQSHQSCGWLIDEFEASECEVLGNIYENPELNRI